MAGRPALFDRCEEQSCCRLSREFSAPPLSERHHKSQEIVLPLDIVLTVGLTEFVDATLPISYLR
jgi:hypothetical protein